MPQSSLIPSIERIVDPMIQLARAAASPCLLACDNRKGLPHSVLPIRRGFYRLARALDQSSRNDPRPARAFSGPCGRAGKWVGPHERTPNQKLRLALGRLGFRIEAGTTCEKGVVVAARRIEASPFSQAA